MNNYVLVLDAFNYLCPRPYMGNLLLEESYHYYLVEKGRDIYELFNKNPQIDSNYKIRCPRCSSQLVKVSINKYKCVICEGR
jgi:uncharacterized protein with PIN domain